MTDQEEFLLSIHKALAFIVARYSKMRYLFFIGEDELDAIATNMCPNCARDHIDDWIRKNNFNHESHSNEKETVN